MASSDGTIDTVKQSHTISQGAQDKGGEYESEAEGTGSGSGEVKVRSSDLSGQKAFTDSPRLTHFDSSTCLLSCGYAFAALR